MITDLIIILFIFYCKRIPNETKSVNCNTETQNWHSTDDVGATWPAQEEEGKDAVYQEVHIVPRALTGYGMELSYLFMQSSIYLHEEVLHYIN